VCYKYISFVCITKIQFHDQLITELATLHHTAVHYKLTVHLQNWQFYTGVWATFILRKARPINSWG